MKSNYGKLFVLVLLITFLSASIVISSSAQFVSDDPPGTSFSEGQPEIQFVSDDPPGTAYSEGQPEIQSEIMAPAAGGSGIYTSSGLEFWPFVPDTAFSRAGVGIFNTSGFSANFETQIHLPHGVTIQQVVVYFYDNDATYDLQAQFHYHSFTDMGTHIFSQLLSSGASPDVRYVTATPPAPYDYVDSVLREYTVEVLLPPSSSIILIAVRVDYSYTNALPLIVK